MTRPLARFLVMMAAAGLAVGAPGVAHANPPGNNGTVKIDGVEFDSHPNNEPHVGCIFQVDFYGYDLGELFATYTFTVQPPTGGPAVFLESGTVFIGEDAAGGGTDLDASATVDLGPELAGYEPHPIQGHHVKLTVNAEGSIGADVKHKVFWVTCEGYAPTLHAARAFSLTSHQSHPETAPSGGLTVGHILGLVLVLGIGRSVLRRKLQRR